MTKTFTGRKNNVRVLYGIGMVYFVGDESMNEPTYQQ